MLYLHEINLLLLINHFRFVSFVETSPIFFALVMNNAFTYFITCSPFFQDFAVSYSNCRRRMEIVETHGNTGTKSVYYKISFV